MASPIAAPINGITDAPNNAAASDNESKPLLQGKQSEFLISQLHGNYYTQAYRGNVFWAVSTTLNGQTIEHSGFGGSEFGLWNPSGSAINVVLIRWTWGTFPTAVQGFPGNIQLKFISPAGDLINTGSPIAQRRFGFNSSSALTGNGRATPIRICSQDDGGGTGLGFSVSFPPPQFLIGTTGISELSLSKSSVATPMWSTSMNFDGTLIVPPNVAIYTQFSDPVNATSTRFTNVLIWEEVPI